MHYVYHPNQAAVIVPAEEYQKYLANGWYDTPAKFPEETKEEAPEKPVSARRGRPAKEKTQEIGQEVNS